MVKEAVVNDLISGTELLMIPTGHHRPLSFLLLLVVLVGASKAQVVFTLLSRTDAQIWSKQVGAAAALAHLHICHSSSSRQW